MDTNVNEQLIVAWLKLSSQVRNDRFVRSMTFNEMFVCSIIYNTHTENVTASMICEQTGILKSQVNKILVGLEAEDMIVRVRDSKDKRKSILKLTKKGELKYLLEHRNIIKIAEYLNDKLGSEKLTSACEILKELADAVSEMQD